MLPQNRRICEDWLALSDTDGETRGRRPSSDSDGRAERVYCDRPRTRRTWLGFHAIFVGSVNMFKGQDDGEGVVTAKGSLNGTPGDVSVPGHPVPWIQASEDRKESDQY